MTFLLRKAETAQERREREKREATEDKETQAAEDASREVYKRYEKLFRDLDFAKRALEPLTELSENMEIIVDKEKATGFEFENISAYNKIISKRESAIAYNILSLSLSENFNPLSNYEFTEENENGDVVLKPQVPPAPKKTTMELGELEERAYDSERDDKATSRATLTTDENFSIFNEGDSAPKNIRRYNVKEKEREIKLNPEINLTELFENYKNLANKTYDEFQDRNGNTLTFEKAFLYLHYNRHGFLPENAKNSKIRGADIERARKLARRRKRETRDEKSYGAAFLQYQDMESPINTKRERKKIKLINRVSKLKGKNENYLEELNATLTVLDNQMKELQEKKGNIKALAKEALKRKLPEIKNLQSLENPLAEIFPELQPKTVPTAELLEARAEQSAQRDMRRRVQSGDIDLDNPTSEGEKLLARANKKILDLIIHQEKKQKEVRDTIRDATRFSNSIEVAYGMIEKSEEFGSLFQIDSLKDRLSNEEDKEKPNKKLIELLENQIKTRKEFNSKSKEYLETMGNIASSIENGYSQLEKVSPKIRELSISKQDYSDLLNELMGVVILGSFTNLGKKYKETKEETPNKLITILEKDNKFRTLLADKEALSILKNTDKFIQESFKIEDLTEGVENLEKSLEDLLDKESLIQTKLDNMEEVK